LRLERTGSQWRRNWLQRLSTAAATANLRETSRIRSPEFARDTQAETRSGAFFTFVCAHLVLGFSEFLSVLALKR
jgi:hypothetical protein